MAAASLWIRHCGKEEKFEDRWKPKVDQNFSQAFIEQLNYTVFLAFADPTPEELTVNFELFNSWQWTNQRHGIKPEMLLPVFGEDELDEMLQGLWWTLHETRDGVLAEQHRVDSEAVAQRACSCS